MLTQAREKYQGVLTVAQNLLDQEPDWVTFFREVLGIEGVVRRAFPHSKDLADFKASGEYEEIQRMLTKLRGRRGTPEKQTEATRVITVRIPKSMHESLLIEAKSRGTSMNKLCISKLVQVIDEDFVPTPPPNSSSRRRKKRKAASTEPSRNGEPEGATDRTEKTNEK